MATTPSWADWNLQWQGLDFNNVPDTLQRALNKVKKGKITDPFAGLVFGNFAKALQTPDLYSENTMRNQGLDLRRSILQAYEPEQRRLEDYGISRGMLDSGAMSRMFGEAQARKENQIRQGISDIFTQGTQANEQYKQQQIGNAMQDLMNYWLLKKRKQQARQGLSDALTQLNAGSGNDLSQWLGLGAQIGAMFI